MSSQTCNVRNGLIIIALLGLLSLWSTAQVRNNSALRPITVTGISPGSGPIGTSVTITGTGFGNSPGKVGFHGVQATITQWSNTDIVAIVPSGASSGPIKICTAAGDCGIAGNFTVTPSITSLDPPAGAVGSQVTILGTAFGTSQGTSTVTLDGQIVIPTSWSDTDIIWTVPGDASSGPVVVAVDGYPSNPILFTVTD